MGRTRDVSKILTSNTSILTLASASATYAPVAAGSLVQIVPTSVSAGATITSTGAVNFTAQSSISLNGCFTSTYDNYLVNCDFTASASVNILLRLRLNGTDSSASYQRQLLTADTTTVSAAKAIDGSEVLFTPANTSRNSFKMDLFGPALARPTTGQSIASENANVGASIAFRLVAFGHNVSTAYDGLTIYPSTGNITGTLRVYGYRN